MQDFDLLLRGGAVAVTLFAAFRPLFAIGYRRKAFSVAALGIAICGYLMISSPSVVALVSPVAPILVGLAVLTPLALTWAVLEIFHDHPRDGWPWLALAAGTVGAAAASFIFEDAKTARAMMAAFLYAGILWVAVRSDSDDVVEARRRFRRVLVAAMVVLGLVITLIEVTVRPDDVPSWLFPLQAGAVLALSAAYAAWTLRPENALWPPAPVVEPTADDPLPSPLAKRLSTLMDNEVWREEGLAIGDLAARLQVPEYRLRAVINRELGFRNFSTFVNQRRIVAAKTALSDPDRPSVTVLEVAFETGFASLGPFNRAFRAETGMSPTEFRQGNSAHQPRRMA